MLCNFLLYIFVCGSCFGIVEFCVIFPLCGTRSVIVLYFSVCRMCSEIVYVCVIFFHVWNALCYCVIIFCVCNALWYCVIFFFVCNLLWNCGISCYIFGVCYVLWYCVLACYLFSRVERAGVLWNFILYYSACGTRSVTKA